MSQAWLYCTPGTWPGTHLVVEDKEAEFNLGSEVSGDHSTPGIPPMFLRSGIPTFHPDKNKTRCLAFLIDAF